MATVEQFDTTFTKSNFSHPYFGDIEHITGEFWTARQRQMHSLHYVISYRASFKPELPDFFINKYTRPGDIVLDPFGGRGTTALQAALTGRIPWSLDVNPLSERLIRPKLFPVTLEEVEEELSHVDFSQKMESDLDLSMFYHPDTERELLALRHHLTHSTNDAASFIELIALSRLHGHSPGFFSVYSFPQISVSQDAQRRINQQRTQQPEYRNVPELILRKAKKALRDNQIQLIREIHRKANIITADIRNCQQLPDESVDCIITSPPFLNKADYLLDNWLEFWFCGIDPHPLREKLVMTPKLEQWRQFMNQAMSTMFRLTRKGRHIAIEVGEIIDRDHKINLDEVLVDIAAELYQEGIKLTPETLYVHQQNFTKLANCFNVDNNQKGTNTNRIALFCRQ